MIPPESLYGRAMTSMIARAAVSSLLLAFGCGSAKPAAEAPTAPGESPTAQTPVPAASAEPSPSAAKSDPPGGPGRADDEVGAPPAKDAPGKAEAKPSSSEDEKDSKKPREVTFQMTPTGLVIDVEGVRMEPKAVAIRLEDEEHKQTGWGVKLTVKVEATDGHVHRFMKPEHGALMMAAEIDRKGKKDRIGDERKGDGEETVTRGAPVTLERTFTKPIWSGQSVTLFVGVWGLGRDTEEKRLIRKLFVVKMVAGNKKPTPVVSPPE